MANMVQCQLWMGNLEPNMTESFILNSFKKLGERPLSVKVMRNKYTGEPAGYCFVHFQTDEEAIDVMHKLNGKPIPGTNPVVRYRLNNASRENKSNVQLEREFSVWVGDLSPDVDDYSLYRVFSTRYSSIKTAKVILDNNGFSKGYGFVRFGLEEEQKNALTFMNGYTGLGSRVLKICTAVPKPKGQGGTTNMLNSQQQAAYGAADYTQYYDPSTYWQNYSQAWSGYYGGTVGAEGQVPEGGDGSQADSAPSQDDELTLIDHRVPLDSEQMNKEFMEQDKCLWDALENSKWFPNDVLEVI